MFNIPYIIDIIYFWKAYTFLIFLKISRIFFDLFNNLFYKDFLIKFLYVRRDCWDKRERILLNL